VLELGNDPLSARLTQVVEQIVAIPSGASGANLDQPRPDLLRGCTDSDGPCGVERRLRDVGISWQAARHFIVGGTPAQLQRAENPQIHTQRLGRVLRNLLGNAQKYSPEHGTILVAVERSAT